MSAKLYYTSTSCGAANFIAAHTAGLNIQCEQVDIREHKTTSGADFYAINPKGNVPTIVLADGTVLNENIATLLWIADQKPDTVAPPVQTKERYELLNALSYVATEIHQGVGVHFAPTHNDATKAFFKPIVTKRLGYVENHLVKGKDFVVGNKFSVVDSYLYIILTWTAYVQIDLAPYPNIRTWMDKIKELPNVKAAQARMQSNPSTVV